MQREFIIINTKKYGYIFLYKQWVPILTELLGNKVEIIKLLVNGKNIGFADFTTTKEHHKITSIQELIDFGTKINPDFKLEYFQRTRNFDVLNVKDLTDNEVVHLIPILKNLLKKETKDWRKTEFKKDFIKRVISLGLRYE